MSGFPEPKLTAWWLLENHMVRSFVEIDVLVPLASQDDARSTCAAVSPYLEGKDCRVRVIHVVASRRRDADSTAVEQEAEEMFSIAEGCFGAVDLPVLTEIWYGSSVTETILEAAEEYSVASIILTPREKSLWKKLRSADVLQLLSTRVDRPLIIIPAAD